MPSWKRNTSGLREAGLKKRTEAILRTEEAIKTLLKEGKPITFNAVLTRSGVSKSWLYGQSELRDRIESLRQQTQSLSPKPPVAKASDKSKDTMITALREQIKALRTDNKALEQQLEVAYGLANNEDVEALQRENRRLLDELQRTTQLLDNAFKDHQVTIAQNKQLRARIKELKAEASGLEGLENEIRDLKKQNSHLMNLLQQVQANERRNGESGFAKALEENWVEIPDIEY